MQIMGAKKSVLSILSGHFRNDGRGTWQESLNNSPELDVAADAAIGRCTGNAEREGVCLAP